MNILIRYWKADHVDTRYLGSEFLGKGSSEHFLQALKSALAPLSASSGQMVQIGMDEPNVNIKLHKLLVEDQKKADSNAPD